MNNLMNLKEKKLMNLKKNDKGFTLIEMVIVLVIIAILAAILIPSMMSWINTAKQRTFQTEARNALTAITALVGQSNATSATPIDAKEDITDPQWTNLASKVGLKTETPGASLKSYCTTLTITDGDVSALVYDNGTFTVSYADGKFGEVTDK